MGIPYLDIHFNLFMKTKWVILVNGKDCLGTIPSNILEVSLKVSLVFISIPLRIKFVFLNSSAVRSYTKHLRERERANCCIKYQFTGQCFPIQISLVRMVTLVCMVTLQCC